MKCSFLAEFHLRAISISGQASEARAVRAQQGKLRLAQGQHPRPHPWFQFHQPLPRLGLSRVAGQLHRVQGLRWAVLQSVLRLGSVKRHRVRESFHLVQRFAMRARRLLLAGQESAQRNFQMNGFMGFAMDKDSFSRSPRPLFAGHGPLPRSRRI